MRFWKNVGSTSSILVALLLSYCILTSISQTSLFDVEAQRLDIISLQDKNNDRWTEYGKQIKRGFGRKNTK